MRKLTTFDKVVNIAEDGEITVLNEVFEYENEFKGATGSIFYPVSEKEYDIKTTVTAISEYLEAGIPTEEIPDEFKYNSKGDPYKNPYKIWAKAIKNEGEEGNVMFDDSYCNLWGYLRETTGLNEKQAYIFECTGAGRCFRNDFQGNVNPELSEIIRKYESK